jgi:hypothetical protein
VCVYPKTEIGRTDYRKPLLQPDFLFGFLTTIGSSSILFIERYPVPQFVYFGQWTIGRDECGVSLSHNSVFFLMLISTISVELFTLPISCSFLLPCITSSTLFRVGSGMKQRCHIPTENWWYTGRLLYPRDISISFPGRRYCTSDKETILPETKYSIAVVDRWQGMISSFHSPSSKPTFFDHDVRTLNNHLLEHHEATRYPSHKT